MKYWLFILLIASCGRRVDPVWSHSSHPLRSFFSESGDDEGNLVWQHSDKKLYSTLKENNKKLVMVRYSLGGLLAYELKENPAVVTESDSLGDDKFGSALVEVQDDPHWEALAAMAHAEAAFGCGMLQLVDLSRPLTAVPDPVVPPVYSEVQSYPQVANLLKQPQKTNIQASMQSFEDLGTRFHNTTTGLAMSQMLKSSIINAIGAAAAAQWDFEEIEHTSTAQKSLIVHRKGATANDVTVIIGAHIDSIKGSRNNSDQSQAPGADDDASGMATMIEAIRILSASDSSFQRRVEFHFYAAEEMGLVGSREIAAAYRADGRTVAAMLQLDMDSYSKIADAKTIYLPTNDTSSILRRSLKDLLNTYLGGDYAEGTISGGTSDHEAWTDQGYAAVFPFEHPTDYNRNIHTANDTVANAGNFALAARFTQLVLAFLSHHAGLMSIAETGSSAAPSTIGSDLKLAATLASSGVINLAVASDEAVAKVTVCPVNAFAAAGCDAGAVNLTLDVKRGERQFHTVAFPFPFVAGMFLRFAGYDSADKLTQQRTVQLSQ